MVRDSCSGTPVLYTHTQWKPATTKFTDAGTTTTVPSSFLALVMRTLNSCGMMW